MSIESSLVRLLSLSAALLTTGSGSEKLAVQANTDFGLDLYAQLAKGSPGKNLFFSPYSISIALAMTAEGARGKTALEMGSVLRVPKSARLPDDAKRPWNLAPLHAGFASSSKRYNRDKKPFTLKVSNALWGEITYPFNQVYLDTLNAAYDSKALRLADFKRNYEAERLRINTWVEGQTEKRIKDLLPDRSLSKITRLVLTNAIYFKGDWASQFDKTLTKEGDFALAGGDSVKALLMHKDSMPDASYAAFNGDGSYFETPVDIGGEKKIAGYPAADGFSMVALPYKGHSLSMVIIAPNDAGSLPKIEAMLSRSTLDSWIGRLLLRKVHVTLPKFTSETKYGLNGTLDAMGLPTAFDAYDANFNGMKKGESDARLYISLVIHKAFVEVNEEGTEAAAATGVVLSTDPFAAVLPFTPHFRADRPFIYLIRDNESGNVLFLGRMMKP